MNRFQNHLKKFKRNWEKAELWAEDGHIENQGSLGVCISFHRKASATSSKSRCLKIFLTDDDLKDVFFEKVESMFELIE